MVSQPFKHVTRGSVHDIPVATENVRPFQLKVGFSGSQNTSTTTRSMAARSRASINRRLRSRGSSAPAGPSRKVLTRQATFFAMTRPTIGSSSPCLASPLRSRRKSIEKP